MDERNGPGGRPRHVAISADGNGRWARQRGLPRTTGHVESQKAFSSVLDAVAELEIPYLSLHVFSSENWKRPADEVASIVALFSKVLSSATARFNDLGVRFVWCGSRQNMPEDLAKTLVRVEQATSGNDRIALQFCLNYGGRSEIVEAAARLSRDAIMGRADPERYDEELFRAHLYKPDVPDVDLFIRTAGEIRFSNFLLWQSAYAEMVFTDTLWPDFRKEDLVSAIAEYSQRKRTLGGVHD